MGDAEGGSGEYNSVGGLVGRSGGLITASYATGGAAGGSGDHGNVGGLVGVQFSKTITASYATGAADGGEGADDRSGALVGWQQAGSVIESYGFGEVAGSEVGGVPGTPRPSGVSRAADLNKDNSGEIWEAWWDFGTGAQNPVLNYVDYGGGEDTTFDCNQLPANSCEVLLSSQQGFRNNVPQPEPPPPPSGTGNGGGDGGNPPQPGTPTPSGTNNSGGDDGGAAPAGGGGSLGSRVLVALALPVLFSSRRRRRSR